MANKPLQVFPLDMLRYHVASEVYPHVQLYLVDLLDRECSCIHFATRCRETGRLCKHLLRAKLYFADQMLNLIQPNMNTKHVLEYEHRNHTGS